MQTPMTIHQRACGRYRGQLSNQQLRNQQWQPFEQAYRVGRIVLEVVQVGHGVQVGLVSQGREPLLYEHHEFVVVQVQVQLGEQQQGENGMNAIQSVGTIPNNIVDFLRLTAIMMW